MCVARKQAITFLESHQDFLMVDDLLKPLVMQFHRIPSCATFGVSCAGSFEETDNSDLSTPNAFFPQPGGSLNVIVNPSHSHIQDLLALLSEFIASNTDTSFKKIDHVFQPVPIYGLEIWEIRVGSNGCLDVLGEDYWGGWVSIQENNAAYRAAKQRCAEGAVFWISLASLVAQFCQRRGYKKFDLQKRIKELIPF